MKSRNLFVLILMSFLVLHSLPTTATLAWGTSLAMLGRKSPGSSSASTTAKRTTGQTFGPVCLPLV